MPKKDGKRAKILFTLIGTLIGFGLTIALEITFNIHIGDTVVQIIYPEPPKETKLPQETLKECSFTLSERLNTDSTYTKAHQIGVRIDNASKGSMVVGGNIIGALVLEIFVRNDGDKPTAQIHWDAISLTSQGKLHKRLKQCETPPQYVKDILTKVPMPAKLVFLEPVSSHTLNVRLTNWDGSTEDRNLSVPP